MGEKSELALGLNEPRAQETKTESACEQIVAKLMDFSLRQLVRAASHLAGPPLWEFPIHGPRRNGCAPLAQDSLRSADRSLGARRPEHDGQRTC